MKQLLQKILATLAYTAAAVLIMMAIVVGLFRLFLPRLPEYQDEIKGWASDALGMQVEFSGMNARWGLSGPELEFYDAELIRPDSQKRVLVAERVGIGVSVGSLVFDQSFVVDHVFVSDTSIEVRQLESGEWWFQGSPLEEFQRAGGPGAQQPGAFQLVGEDIEILFLQPGDERPRRFEVPRSVASIDDQRIAVDATIRLPDDLGRLIELSATRLVSLPETERGWDVRIEGDNIDLSGWSDLREFPGRRFLSGGGDLEVALAIADGEVVNAAGQLDFRNISTVEGRLFDLGGRFELDVASDGWFVEVDRFSVATEEKEWPESSLRVEASVDDAGAIVVLAVDASYADFGDASLLLPWLPADRQQQLLDLGLDGIVRDLDLTVYNLGAESPSFDIEAQLIDFGIAPQGKIPGVRGFTATISASHERGHIDMASEGMQLELPTAFDIPLQIEELTGSVTWRSDASRTLIITDRIIVSTPFFDSRSDGDLTIGKADATSEINLDMSWGISDIAAARRYVPRRLTSEKFYNWFQNALVRGSIPRGTMRLSGPLDKFPFPNDEGKFLVEGSVRNLTMQYSAKWPAAEQADIEIVLDNTRLYSVRNRSIHAGNQTVDADIEIADLRDPVLTINGLVTGTLDSLGQFARQSPINTFLGGNLERITLTGDASMQLDLTVPLRDTRATTVNALVRSNGGSLQVAGLNAPITDLFGDILITRDAITGDSLGARFLGEDVELRVGPATEPGFYAVATATGIAPAPMIIEQLGLPLQGIIDGVAPYEARIMFPGGRRSEAEEKEPFTIRIATPMRGMALNLPEPVGKIADEAMLLRGDIRFMPSGEQIESRGFADNDIAWDLAFTRPEGSWALDRGVVQAGGGAIEGAETRGLHLRGRVDTLRLEEWLSVSRSKDEATNAAGTIRSADMLIDNFYAIGQHLVDHRVRVDRSARDWLVQIEGEDVVGSLFVPYEFGTDRAMVIEMERMRLPGDEEAEESDGAELDPRKLPPITLKAEEFALGDRYLGAVDAVLVRTEDGLVTEKLEAIDDTFQIVGSGTWLADQTDELGSRTTVTASLNSRDVATTLQRLDFVQGVSGDTMGVLFDLSWSGGPRADFLALLDGNVKLRLENGQLEEVEPGAGRMLGLISFVALPRRLSLDFRDVFNKGFGYDSIAGSFDIVDGVASTCDMNLQGPAADIGIVGQVDLAAKEYQQGAIISANVGNTLPIVGAVVGGPPGAAAMLIFSQIFKKPLQEVGQVYYGMSGPWDEPAIDSISSSRFVDYGRLAGCLNNEAS
jgi:uncharacterized protein (TIGR02099 family)